MEVEKTMASLFSPRVKLDRFDGTNFAHWKGKLFFLLTVLKIAYVIYLNLLPIPKLKDNNSEVLKVEMKKRQDNEVICRGHILNIVSNRLYDLYNSIQSPKEI